MGSYPQNVIYDQPIEWQVIEWQVLAIENNRMLIISRYGLEERLFGYNFSNSWENSDIRKWLNGDLLKGFSEDTDVLSMLEVEKATYTVNDEGAKEEVTADKLFLLSASEVGFALGDFVHDEGAVYPFFDGAPENRRKTELNDPATARGWWLRSPYPGYAYHVRRVLPDGSLNSSPAYYGYGAAAACVIY